MISIMRYDNKIDECTGDERKPEMITFYNMTKSGVDKLDQLCTASNVSRNTRRCPMTVIYAMLNIAVVNSYIGKKNLEGKYWRALLRQLSAEFVDEHAKRRGTIKTLPKELGQNIRRAYQD